MCQVRTGSGLAALLPLATAPPPEAAAGEPPPPPRTTQTAAIRALLAACSLPCNRTYLLLSPHVAGLAFSVLPAAVEQAAEAARRAADASDTATPIAAAGGAVGGAAGGAAGVAEGAEGGTIDALLLPLLKLLRLLIATRPPAEPVRKLQSDLVCLLIFSGASHRLTFAPLLAPDDTPSLAFRGGDLHVHAHAPRACTRACTRTCTCTCACTCTCTWCRRAARAAGPLHRG